MPESEGVSLFDDENEDYSGLLGLVASQTKGKAIQNRHNINKSPAFFSSSSFQPVPSQSNFLSPIDISIHQSQPVSETEDFIDKYLELEVLEKWFERHKQRFIDEVFPQFLVPTITSRFSLLFSEKDLFEFTQNANHFGDLENPSERDRVYSVQSDYLYSTLQRQIQKRPSLICALISALRIDDWHHPLADGFEAELNIWRKHTENQLLVATPAFPLPTPGTPMVLPSQVHSLPAPPATPYLTNLIKPTHKLFNIPEPIAYFVARNAKRDELMYELQKLSRKGLFKGGL